MPNLRSLADLAFRAAMSLAQFQKAPVAPAVDGKAVQRIGDSIVRSALHGKLELSHHWASGAFRAVAREAIIELAFSEDPAVKGATDWGQLISAARNGPRCSLDSPASSLASTLQRAGIQIDQATGAPEPKEWLSDPIMGPKQNLDSLGLLGQFPITLLQRGARELQSRFAQHATIPSVSRPSLAPRP